MKKISVSRLRKISIALCIVLVVPLCHCSTDAPPATKASTAQPEVSLLPQQLDMPGLNRSRQIRIYLPPNYTNSKKHFPVLYMHDGQNLFDVATAYAGEWKVDETMNGLARASKLELIVIGIDNGQEKRMVELNPWANPRFGAPEGAQYMEFVVNVVKPYIDQHYRTKSDRANTAIMGSSMGGLISHYAIVQYPEVFGMAGIFSPSYWVASPSFAYFDGKPAAPDARLYFLAGEKEGGDIVRNTERVYASITKNGAIKIHSTLKIVPGAQHNEVFWSSEFERAVLWLFTPNSENAP